MEDMRRIAFETVLRACGFGSLAIFCIMIGLSFEPREKAKHKATLFGMYVPDARRQQGIGRSLVLAALAHARARPGMRVVQLTVTEGNVAAEALYEQCGFVRFGIEPFAIAVAGRFLSKVHMWCDLEELPLAR